MNNTQEDLMTQSYFSPEEDEKQNPQASRSTHSRKSSERCDLPAGTVTLLFTDIEGSTHLLQQLGNRYTDVLTEYRQLQRAIFHEYHGYEVDTQGDAFFTAFARTRDAVAAAVATQRTLARHSWGEGITIRVRIGIHTGEPELTAEGYVGIDVHFAARLMNAGHGGQVLLSQTTRDLLIHNLPDDVALRDLGEHRLKDLSYPQHLFQLVIANLPSDFPKLSTQDTYTNNLPVHPSPLIGRKNELARILYLMRQQDVRLLTLTGIGGVGKTRLAIQAAAELSDECADGVYFVSLAPIRDSALVIPTIAQALGIRDETKQPLLERLKEDVRQKQLLLLLDNFEQVIAAAPSIADLLAVCPKLRILVTSRETLHIQIEHELRVPPLPQPDFALVTDLAALSQNEAVELFIKRAQGVRPDFYLTAANAQAIAEICARLDGLPLAIELAAARSKLLSPQALLARLGNRLNVLTSDTQDIPVRQQTLRNTLEWSYHLLDSQQQQLFRMLSVFVGGGTLEAIEAISAALKMSEGVALDGTASLLDKSLLQAVEQEEETRFFMLETIREYVVQALSIGKEAEKVRQAHAEYYLSLAEHAYQELDGVQESEWLKRLEREQDNVRAALSWLLEPGRTTKGARYTEMALRLSTVLWPFWGLRGNYSEARSFLEQAIAVSEGAGASIRAKALYYAARIAHTQGNNERAEQLCKESLALYQELHDVTGSALALHHLADIAWTRGDLETARVQGEEALEIFRKMNDIANVAFMQLHLATLAIDQGDYTKGYRLLEENLNICRELHDKSGIAEALMNVARAHFLAGDLTQVRTFLEESYAFYNEMGDKESRAYCYCQFGLLALCQDDLPEARSKIEAAVELFKEMSQRHGTATSLSFLAKVATRQGNLKEARKLYEESLTVARSSDNKLSIIISLEGLASVIAGEKLSGKDSQEKMWAARLWGCAEQLREGMGTPLSPFERSFYNNAIGALRETLGEKAFIATRTEGRALTLEQAIAGLNKDLLDT
jgi:predicted ATPase/class 3 adenylate cyclase